MVVKTIYELAFKHGFHATGGKDRTKMEQVPKSDWLNYVVTAKAKSKIKSALKEEKKKIKKRILCLLLGPFKPLNWLLMGVP